MKMDLKNNFNLNRIRISKKSFFCGDAAGRISPSPFRKKLYPNSVKGDFSDSDYKFALNIGINFITPEDFLMENPPVMDVIFTGFDPNKFMSNLKNNTIEYNFKPRKKELIIIVALPGSGKTEL